MDISGYLIEISILLYSLAFLLTLLEKVSCRSSFVSLFPRQRHSVSFRKLPSQFEWYQLGTTKSLNYEIRMRLSKAICQIEIYQAVPSWHCCSAGIAVKSTRICSNLSVRLASLVR